MSASAPPSPAIGGEALPRRPDRPGPTPSPSGVVGGRYRLLRPLAAGGMGEVFVAHDVVLERRVAVKLLSRRLATDAAFVERFRREARAAASLSHPNVVAVYDRGEADGQPFMVMELVRGPSLRELLTAVGRLTPAQAVDVLSQILDALEHAHAAGVVHRDLKPENVLIGPGGAAKVADFGLARALADGFVSSAGDIIGTPHYLAPEQVLGRPAEPATDLYSLGIVAFELLTGRVPFRGETAYAIAHRHVEGSVPPPSSMAGITAALDAWVGSLTARDPAARPASAGQARRELHEHARALPPPALPVSELAVLAASPTIPIRPARTVPGPTRVMPSGPPTPVRSRRRSRRRLAAAVGAIVIVIGGLASGAWVLAPDGSITVPDVTGVRAGRAQAALEAEGLIVRPRAGGYSTSIEKGRVLRTNPTAGTVLDEGSVVRLFFSQGPPPVAVPSVVGLDFEAAARRLGDAGLALGAVHRRYDDAYAEGEVAAQSVAGGLTLPEGSEVDLTVSRGFRPFELPSVLDLPGDEAAAQLESYGLRVQTEDVSILGFTGTNVVLQKPSAGASVRPGDTVVLYLD
jgi:beta-lactam-binding protein with PASTA domain/tRNA A-37 threonylcarbamoyl transferase component Bud32